MASAQGASVHTGIERMYVEGEVRDGYFTGRTILVIETSCEIDPASPAYSSLEIVRLTKLACEQWVVQFGSIDLVRLERVLDLVPESHRRAG